MNSPTTTTRTPTGTAARVGSLPWSVRTGGQLTGAQRRRLLPPLARTHLGSAVGRTAMTRAPRPRATHGAPRAGAAHAVVGAHHPSPTS